MAGDCTITVRISEARLRKLMRARVVRTQAELMNTLLDEEEERLRSHAVLRDTTRRVRTSDVRDLPMRTKLMSHGQVSIPAAIRRKLRITANTALEWIVEGDAMRVIPIPGEPIAALRGSGKQGAVRRLLEDRRRDRRDG